MMTKERRKRIEFFAEHSGYATPPGRMPCAKLLADAEQEAEERDWSYVWDEDADADVSWMDDKSEDYKERSYFLFCSLVDQNGAHLASLGGIHFLRGNKEQAHRRDYGRVVEAELAAEAIAREERDAELIREAVRRDQEAAATERSSFAI